MSFFSVIERVKVHGRFDGNRNLSKVESEKACMKENENKVVQLLI